MKNLKLNIKKLSIILTLSTILITTSPVNYQVFAKETVEEESMTKYFKDILNNIKNFLNSKKVKNAKEKSIKLFIKTIDFIFYDTEINGYTFKDLTEEQKEEIIDLFKKMDNLLEKKYPNYKEELEESYSYVVLKTKEEFESIDDLIISVIGEDNYNKLNEATKETIDQTKEEFENIKDQTKKVIGEDNINKLNEATKETIDQTKEEFENIIDETSKILNKGKQKVKSWYEKLRGNYQ